ncbi:MAG: ABC transporter ATP-binding protein, partial [Gemmatimonadetes bacterium]|nr:ABC transporter ATP-binding protein [Gemmatimonadota bacterium]
MSNIVIEAVGLGKQYRIGATPRGQRNFREVIANAATAPLRNFRRLRSIADPARMGGDPLVWALRDLSFTLREGEVLGIIGRNGAGKSTLLKILTRVTEPTTGYADVWGRVGSLLEVGTGFHPELTGRDNVYLNGAILGMDRPYIRSRFEEIVEFAGIGAFIDTPVKRYSSGMYVRLAFAVAAHLEPEILIVDEVLAVGDAEFQQRCLAKMDDVAHGGRTVLFVSHNLPSVQRLCPRSIMLHGGRILADGPSTDVINRYLAGGAREAHPGHWIDLDEVARTGSGLARFQGIRYSSGSTRHQLQPFTRGRLELGLTAVSNVSRDVNLSVSIWNQSGTKLINADTTALGRAVALRQGTNTFRLTIERLYLKPGAYVVGLWLGDRMGETLDRIESAFRFEVVDPHPERPTVRLDSRYDGPVACRFDVAEV